MALEIERKFLVANDGWKNFVTRLVRIRDGLIANNKGHKAGVRITNDVATIALKSRKRGLVRDEFEYVIPLTDAEEMLRTMCDGNVIDKVRHFISHASNTWQVDVYEGLLDGVVLAEIELTDADRILTLRGWIGQM
jgi:CYTH domain-containing protein